jgi:hypothetical protein
MNKSNYMFKSNEMQDTLVWAIKLKQSIKYSQHHKLVSNTHT